MCSEHQHDHDPKPHAHGRPEGHIQSAAHAAAAGDTAECPVMPGSLVNKADAEEDGLVRDFQGRTYYLCCDACGPLWDAEPARYAQPAGT